MVEREETIQVGQLFKLRRGINPKTRDWLIRNVGFRNADGREFFYGSAIVNNGKCVSFGGTILPSDVERFRKKVLTVDEFNQLARSSVQEGVLSSEAAQSFIQDFATAQETNRTRNISWQE